MIYVLASSSLTLFIIPEFIQKAIPGQDQNFLGHSKDFFSFLMHMYNIFNLCTIRNNELRQIR